ANMVNYLLGLLILFPCLIYFQRLHLSVNLLWFPVTILVQLVFTTALALVLSGLSVLFGDIRDLLANVLMLWFFATPIIYPWFQENVRKFRLLFNVNPFTHLAVSYQEILFYGPVGHWKWLIALGAASVFLFPLGSDRTTPLRGDPPNLLRRALCDSASLWFALSWVSDRPAERSRFTA